MRRVLSFLVVLVASLATLGHICVLPTHVHALPAAPDHDRDHDDADHSEPVDDGMHAASCDALRPGTTAAATPITAASTLPIIERLDNPARERLGDAPVPTGSPPLYIVHRTLLI